MDLEKDELEWLASHLGHDLNTHENFYGQQEGVIELTKVSKIIYAVENGDMATYTDKKLSEIPVNGILPCESRENILRT